MDKENEVGFLREKRLELNLGLRAFCLDLSLEASYWSRAERGLEKFPKEVIDKIVDKLDLSDEEAEILEKWDPIIEDPEKRLLRYLPAFPPRDFPLKEYLESLI